MGFGKAAGMRDLAMSDPANIPGRQGNDRDGLAIERRELHLVALPASVHQHYRADITAGQAVSRQVTFEDHVIKFGYHADFLFRGYAVTKRGVSVSRLINHTLRTFKASPSRAINVPSTT